MFKLDSAIRSEAIDRMELEKTFPIIRNYVNNFSQFPFIKKYGSINLEKLVEKLHSDNWNMVHSTICNYNPKKQDEKKVNIAGIEFAEENYIFFSKENSYIYISVANVMNTPLPNYVFDGEKVTNICNVSLFTMEYMPSTFIDDLVCSFTTKKDKVYFICSSKDGYFLKESNIKEMDIDISLLYGDELAQKHPKIVSDISDIEQRGIYFLHGEHGTGKSSYIRHLISQITNRRVIIVSPTFVNDISSPNFIPFLLNQPPSVLVIEDAENIIRSREGNSGNSAISNLLNIGDGLLGDCLNMQIICTFNTAKEKIDEALLRKGRLKNEHYFTKLSFMDAQKVLDAHGIKFTAEEDMSLAEIFNTENFSLSEKMKKPTKQIGFHKNN